MTTKGNVSEIGESSPTETTKSMLDGLVNDVLGETPASEPENKEGLEEEKVEGEESEAADTTEEKPENTFDEKEEEDEEESEEVVPKSKHQKVKEKMQDRINSLTAKLHSQNEKAEAKTPEDKLANLSATELADLKENADDAIMDAKVTQKVDGTDQSAKITELKNLKKQIDSTVANAPKRFFNKQVKHLTEAIQEVKDIDPAVEKQSGDLWNLAVQEYKNSPSRQQSEMGMAEALFAATNRFIDKKSFDSGREKTGKLAREMSNMKKKTSLDSKTLSVDEGKKSFKKLREKALRGTYDDKLAFVQNALVPEEFLK